VSVGSAERAEAAGARARSLVAGKTADAAAGARDATSGAAPGAAAGWTSPPPEPPIDERRCREVLAELAGASLLKHVAPAAWGGAAEGVEVSALAAIREELAYESGLHDLLFVMQGLGSFPITYAGDDTQKRQWLPRVVSGEAIAAFAVTEPGAGSDVGAIATAARRDGDGYVLDGTKIFISNAPYADVFTVIAQCDAAKGRKGLTAFADPSGRGGSHGSFGY
jgi:acyl-CoA dehydrogenase